MALQRTRDGASCLHFNVLGPAPLRPIVRLIGFSMHKLPFGAKMTEKLLLNVEEQHRSLANEVDCAWSFVYGEKSRVFRSISWVLTSIPKTQAEPERLFVVAGIPFYIAYEVEPWVENQIFDMDGKGGVVSHESDP